MVVVKRDGREVEFDKQKIVNAIEKAMIAEVGSANSSISNKIANEIESTSGEKTTVEDIELAVYNKLISHKQKNVAKLYEDYRAVREYQRKKNTIDQKVLGVVRGDNFDIKDNSNKNTKLISTMRDLVAEEVSKDIALRTMLPPDIATAHNDGLIYIHDLGHYLNPSFNCCLVNLEDMLQNGTVINGKLITRPHTFRTACTIATQIIAQVASGQFGGQTIWVGHLAPFVRDSKNKIENDVINEFNEAGFNPDSVSVSKIVDKMLKEEVNAGVQTLQYQINTLQTSNGQAPFLSVSLYIPDGYEYEEETAMIVEEMLRQRLKGMQNEVGAWITPAFPKLLYVSDKNNIYKGSKYYYLTELAAECIAHRMMPDCLSAKILRENYGDIVPPINTLVA